MNSLSVRKEQIIAAALKVFARRGMAAKMSEIAAEAKLSHGLVYHYFASKEAVFIELVMRALDSPKELYKQVESIEAGPKERLRLLTEAMLEGIKGEGAAYFLIMIYAFMSNEVPEEVKKLLDERSASGMNMLVPVLEEGQREGGIIPGDAVKLAALFFSLIQGLAISRMQMASIPLPEADEI
ncbi:TetR/AcrR family transcriptional regulator, partial [Paenibacillus senegalensis]|uniref:TetR/AcrR family transcriptional regulator n=1 Tax=Paenibacillus senegalensis TaxID=1465766 RepID=UPI000289B9E0